MLCTIERPAILFEGGFVSNPDEGRLVASSRYQDKLAQSICDGIINYSAVDGRRQIKSSSGRPMGATTIGGRPSTAPATPARIHGNNTYRGTTRL